MYDFAIVGGGVIGLMMTREPGLAGAKVALLERTACARESSWAGGGIVSPLYPWRYHEAVTRLATWSQSSYQHLAQALQEETGCDPQLRGKGMFMVAVEDAADALRWAEQFHRPLRQVDSAFLYQLEPHFQPGFTEALWMPEVASIRNPRLGQALRASLTTLENIQVFEQAAVSQLLLNKTQVVGAKTEQQEILAGHTIIAAGAWSGQLLAPLGVALPVEPVKGQMMVFKAQPGLVERVILMGGRYVIPRNDGRILVGSTLEHNGFDKAPTQDAYTRLRQTAVTIIPALAGYPVEHHWAGLRPGSPQGIPFIGAVPGYSGLSVNAGHYRNGLVLAPASTRLLADQLLGKRPAIAPEPYWLEGRLGHKANIPDDGADRLS